MTHCTTIAMHVWLQDVSVDKGGHEGGFMVWFHGVAPQGGSIGWFHRVVPRGCFPEGGSPGWFHHVVPRWWFPRLVP